ncbi:McrC family protein [Luteibacter sp. CQ10]|uniref:McrC family protein n=1 Tax=Luteibacter sp. CQ10 TaxID=2805821 RepID=UPI0034A1D4B5
MHRVISVLEHETVPILSDADAARLAGNSDAVRAWLTEAEANALLRRSERGPRICERTSAGIRFSQFCGLLSEAKFILEILPKTGLDDLRQPGEMRAARQALLDMLSCARSLTLHVGNDVGQEAVRAPLLEVFIQAFLNCILVQARRGLLHRYLEQSENLRSAKGRINVHRHLRTNITRPHLLHCDFDEFTVDNPYNRAIRAALDISRPWLSSTTGQRLWLECHARFADITPTRMHAEDVAALRRDRTTRHYEPALDWCERLLSLLNPSLRSGGSCAPGLLFNMNRLFEDYVHYLERQDAMPDEQVHAQGPARPLARAALVDVFQLKPDVTVWRRPKGAGGAGVVRIIDAKWKRLQPNDNRWGVSPADIYQLLAYAVRYGCTELELVYPAPTGWASDAVPPSFVIDNTSLTAPVHISVRMLNLAGPARL